MKKNYLLAGIMILFGLSICLITSCKKENETEDPAPTTSETPFNNGTTIRNLILVISDIHLGANASYEECNVNRTALVHFLQQVRNSPNVKELVIAGDFFDEWFVPDTVNTYQGGTQTGFVQQIAATNQAVFDALNNIITDGNILVTYVPGNHDLTISEANVSNVLPGISQCRDAGKLGLGSYSPVEFPGIVIEHGHRYNFFCAPDPISNQTIAPGTILPPGYFFTRIAAQHVVEGCEQNIDTLPVVTLNPSATSSQTSLYYYWQIWAWAVNALPVNQLFSDEVIITNVNNFTGNYSIDDLIPYQSSPGGTIQVNLFNGIQDNWATRCNQNNVNVPIPTDYAINNANTVTGTDTMASW